MASPPTLPPSPTLVPPFSTSVAPPPAPVLGYALRVVEPAWPKEQKAAQTKTKPVGPNAIAPIASEQGRAWDHDEVVIKLDPDTLQTLKPQPNGTVALSPRPVAGQSPLEVGVWIEDVRKTGPHSVPITWKLLESNVAVLTAAEPTLEVPIAGRARISAWADPQKIWNPTTHKLHERFRKLDFRGLDDITLLTTVFLDENNKVDWAKNFLTGAPSSPDPAKAQAAANATRELRKTFLLDCIQFFHARNVQVFVGFYVDTGVRLHDASGKRTDPNREYGDRFVKWLRSKPDFAAHAQELVGFFKALGADIDGISYDLEIGSEDNGAHPGLAESDKEAIAALFDAVATALEPDERYVAYATSAFTAKYGGVMTSQPFTLTQRGNLIARPMSYSSPREQMVDYALGTQKVHPACFQVGMGRTPPSDAAVHADISRECEKVYSRHRVGLIHWNLQQVTDVEAYARHDAKLNPFGPPHGTPGQPLQGPLGPKRISAFIEATRAEERASEASAKHA